jgi:hypothetical protein
VIAVKALELKKSLMDLVAQKVKPAILREENKKV